jgi:DNA-directed RNA polymerase subunit RPC12/RpoP
MPKVVGQDTSVAKRVTCSHCGAINEYLPDEVRELYRGKDMSGCSEGYDGFNCGQCGKEIHTWSF